MEVRLTLGWFLLLPCRSPGLQAVLGQQWQTRPVIQDEAQAKNAHRAGATAERDAQAGFRLWDRWLASAQGCGGGVQLEHCHAVSCLCREVEAVVAPVLRSPRDLAGCAAKNK